MENLNLFFYLFTEFELKKMHRKKKQDFANKNSLFFFQNLSVYFVFKFYLNIHDEK